MDDVRYERLRPRAIRAARTACPILYIPIGTLEWHGWHNPVGLDTLKAHALAMRAARAGGGLVFPPLYYGESRDEALIDSRPEHREQVAEAMGWPAGSLAPGHMRRSPAEQAEGYIRLLLHILNEGRSLGFRVLVLVCGHYPLIDFARSAALLFHQQRYGDPDPLALPIPWAFSGYELVRDVWPDAGDHGSWWETSLLMALEPGLCDLAEEGQPRDLGIGGPRPLDEASPETGEQAAELIAARAAARARDRLDRPEKYAGHNLTFD